MADEPKRYFRIKNWDRYQDFHHRSRKNDGPPPWIKLSTAFFDDAGLADLPDSQRLAWVALLICAAKARNRIRWCPAKIRQRYGLRRAPDLELFLAQGFIEEFDVNATDTGEERRGEEIRQNVQADESKGPSPQPEQPRVSPSVSVNRERLLSDGAKLIAQIAEITGEDPTTIVSRATSANGKYKPAISLEGLRDPRLAFSVLDLRKDLARVALPSEGSTGVGAGMLKQLAEKRKASNG